MGRREAEMREAIRAAELDDDDEATFVKPSAPRKPAQVYSIRIPVERIEQLRRVAEEMGYPPSTLMRGWVLERLDEEGARKRRSFKITRPWSGFGPTVTRDSDLQHAGREVSYG